METPRTVAELEEVLGDSGKAQALLSDKEKFKAFMGEYSQSMIAHDPDIQRQLAEAKRLPLADTPGGGVPRGAKANPFPSKGEFYKAIFHRNLNMGADIRLKDLSEGIGSEGGFLVPEVMRAELMKLGMETAVVRPRARIIPMDSLSVPFPVIKETSRATSVRGGIVAYWTDESASITESQPAFGRITLTAHKLAGYTEVPNELIQDSLVSLEALLNMLFPEAVAFYEDDAFINGTGAGQPLGILNANCLVSVAKETGQAATTLVWENIVKMYSRMLPESLMRAVWVAHIDTLPQLAVMSLAVGTGGSAVWINNGVTGPPVTILGRPVIFTEKCQTLGTKGDIYFADFGHYLIGDRQSMSMASSPHYKFPNDQTVYRFIERVDGQPWLQAALTPKYGSNTLSPFISLDTRA